MKKSPSLRGWRNVAQKLLKLISTYMDDSNIKKYYKITQVQFDEVLTTHQGLKNSYFFKFEIDKKSS